MNIDDLKNSWTADTTDDRLLPSSNLSIRQSYVAVNTIRRTMKIMFVIHITICISLCIILSILYPGLIVVSSMIALAISLLIAIPYWWRFYIFYKQLGSYDLRLKKSIRIITFDLQLHVEHFRSYLFSSSPLLAFLIILIFFSTRVSGFVQGMVTDEELMPLWPVAVISLLFFAFTGFLWLLSHLYIHHQYGLLLREIHKLAEDLEYEI